MMLTGHINRPSTSQGNRNDARSLALWGWTDKVESWDPSQIDLLKRSWRPSTRKTYDVAWNRWVKWANLQKIDATSPEGSDLAQFLADLHLKSKLSYNTIVLHKSVVSTLCNAGSSGKLNDDVLVRHILKSISQSH